MNHFGKLHRISLILNIMFLILMPKIYSFDNIYLSIIWTLLGITNAVYLLIKDKKTPLNVNKLKITHLL